MTPSALNPHDHAVVIAIRRYIDAEVGFTALEGPDNDAAAVADWLKHPDGGGLPAENVHVVSSADVPDPFPDGRAQPDQEGVIAALDAVALLPKGAFEGQFAGRRLYVYISGHGWAREPDEAALVTAEATKADPVNVLVTSWTRWMHKAAPFKELVLWADTCATRVPLNLLHPCVLPETVSNNLQGVGVFEAFAAPLGLRAVEARMPDGRCHGVFTYTLLKGLTGGAPSPVTSTTLADYMRNTMKEFMPAGDRARKTVAHEPAFGRTNPMVFATRPPARFPVTLRFPPDCVGRRAIVGTGPSTPPVAETVLGGQDWTVQLEAGFWGVFVEDAGITDGFAVTGGRDDVTVIVS